MQFNYTDRFITVDDLKVRYWDEGSGDPLLLIHGLGVPVETWAWNIEALSNRHRVIALDIPGFGKSSRLTRNGVYSLEYAGQFLYRFVTGLEILRLSVAGNSMGGMLAIQFALMHPEVMGSLILVDSAGLGNEINKFASLIAIWPIGELLVHPIRPFVKLLAKALLYRQELVTDEFVDRMLELSKVPGTKEAMLAILRSGVNLRGQFDPYREDKLRKLTMPVLVVWGKQDLALPVKHAETALRAIPNCRAVVLDKAGHAPQMDRPETFNQLVLEFLENGRLSVKNASGERRMIYL